MRIEFDPGKDEVNQAKHGVSLAFGAKVLADGRRLDILDVWVCVYTERGKVRRLISVRKASARETNRYRNAPR
jgi:uncharacterized DUF497 family protein